MRIRHIGHACLHIESGDIAIITDPWLHGPAYCGQWHIFPRPVQPELAEGADVILISHGHEDHLHEPTLRRMRRDARIYYPYSWYGGIKPYLKGLGFRHVTEAITSRTYALNEDISITYIANNLDSIIVIEDRGQVMVNINDALHAYHPNVIDAFVRMIRERWPHIDTLFCGFGGASYFPNAIHAPGKDDLEIARVREQLFVHNFCRITHALSPKLAIPFAADFVLLEPWQRWINTVRFPRDQIGTYFHEYFGTIGEGTTIRDIYPGDEIDEGRFIPSSPYRPRMLNGSLDHLIEEEYAPEIRRRQTTFQIPEIQAGALLCEIRDTVNARAALFDAGTLAAIRFSVRVLDVAEENCYTIAFHDGEASVIRGDAPDPDSILVMETTSRILRYSFASEWGGDAITIGYGAEIFVASMATIDAGLDTVCVRLLTRHPATTRHMKREPLRAARFLLSNPLTRKWAVRQLRRGGTQAQEPAGRKEWLQRTKCEICRICDLPLLDQHFSADLQ